MSAFALYLVLAAALLHASWNLLAKKAGGGNHFVLLAALFVTLLRAPAAVWVGLAAVERLGALTGALIAGYSVVDGDAVKMLLLSPILVDYIGNLLRVPVMRPFALPDRRGFLRTLRSQWRPALVVATLGPLSYVLVLYALTMAPLSHVAPAREVSMLFAALLGGQLLGEGDRVLRLVGAAAIALGVAGLALG